MTDKNQTVASPRSASLADVALLDIDDVCEVLRMGPTWVHDAVRAGTFPRPLRFGPRCTRWKAADVRQWLIDRINAAAEDTKTDAIVSARAEKASRAARTPEAVAKAAATKARNIAARSAGLLAA